MLIKIQELQEEMASAIAHLQNHPSNKDIKKHECGCEEDCGENCKCK